MFLTKTLSASLLILTAYGLVGEVSLSAAPATTTGQTLARQKEPPKSPPKETRKWPGEWLLEENADQPCAIFQH